MAEIVQTTYQQTPIGIAKIVGDFNGIQSVSVLDVGTISEEALNTSVPECLQECVVQLDEYFKGKRESFNLTVNPKGTKFQLKVWKSLLKIKYGKSTNYLAQSKS